MELDRVLYIFGSFTRRKDKRRSLEPGSLSAGSTPLHLQKRPASGINGDIQIAPRTSAYEEIGAKLPNEWKCGLCHQELREPRVLGCLHQFCTKCLQGLHQDLEVWKDGVNGSNHSVQEESRSASVGGSAGSGYETDVRNRSESDASWSSEVKDKRKYGIYTRKISGKSVQLLLCPTCGHETLLPLAGISALPLNSILQRKMNTHYEETASVLCDLCITDTKIVPAIEINHKYNDLKSNGRPFNKNWTSLWSISVDRTTVRRGLDQCMGAILSVHPIHAESKCNQCLVSICSSCGEAHGRHKSTRRHSLEPLLATDHTRRCNLHPKADLSVYCATCQQVVCRDCCIICHSGHALAAATRSADERRKALRDACGRARHMPDHVHRLTKTLHARAHEDDIRASLMESEMSAWTERYRRAVESHSRSLLAAASSAREAHRQKVAARAHILEEKLHQVDRAVKFAEEVLEEGNEEEVLVLSGAALRRLEKAGELSSSIDPPTLTMRFSPVAPTKHDGVPVVGCLLTREADYQHCFLNTDGLQDLKVGHDNEVILELRDNVGDRIWCGGEQVGAFIRRRDSSARPDTANVLDRGDGTYSIRVAPPKPGAYLLAVTLNNKPINGSPFVCGARVNKSHTGQYHCCAFCSSEGQKDTVCACGGTMSGGYKGCGHGHVGHPGAHHWSCCGSTIKNGPCIRKSHPIYQFSL